MALRFASVFKVTENPRLRRASAISFALFAGFRRGEDLYASLPITNAIRRSCEDIEMLGVKSTNKNAKLVSHESMGFIMSITLIENYYNIKNK